MVLRVGCCCSVNRHDAIRFASLADRSTGQIRTTPVTVANGQTIRVAAVGIGVSGEAFANSSSLSLRWELSSCEGLAYWWADAYELQRLKSSWERFLVLQNESGEVLPELAFFFFFLYFMYSFHILYASLLFLNCSEIYLRNFFI